MEQEVLKNKPVSYRAGTVKVLLWTNKAKDKDGNDVFNHTITLERIYKDKDDKWQSTQNFEISHLTTLQRLISHVVNDLYPVEKKDK